ncbi:MAG: helix-turn-helix domain-containing protein [Hydrogenophaga sp.]|nr:helix-turn-helix domain-containing protein [Hydrogenophaga sp.]
MAKVWELSQHGGTSLLMLLAIADFADDEGNAYPSVTTLAEKCRMKQRNAQVILSALRESGELVVRSNEGPKGTNTYRVTLATPGVQSSAPLQGNAPLQRNASTGAKECANRVQHSAPKPSMNHQEPPICSKRAEVRCPGGVDAKVWEDFLTVRKAKRAPLTATALDGIAGEAIKAGMTLTDALAMCCARGWQSFKAEWVAKSMHGAGGRYRTAMSETESVMANLVPGVAARTSSARPTDAHTAFNQPAIEVEARNVTVPESR